jgi:phage repressor protein C with HTH and peptisase S24 domain/DNA-binding XRE family transcriptional regulator
LYDKNLAYLSGIRYLIAIEMDALGTKLRRQRRKLGLTLDELARRTDVSKPYLSLIENGRVAHPPSDEKLQRLEETLAFAPGELVSQAHLERTPSDVRAILQKLAGEGTAMKTALNATMNIAKIDLAATVGVNLDDAYLSGVLQQMVEQASANVEMIQTHSVPVINRVSAGYPSDFTDLSYPPRVADEYVGCPEVNDTDAFAARVHGDSMMPKYHPGDIVIFSPAAGPREGDDCFVRFEDGQTTFKRVFFESDADGAAMIRLQPRNEKYRPQVVPAENVSGLYRAMYRYQRVDEE